MDKYERIGRELVYKGVIIDYYQDTIKIPNGNIAKWDFIKHKRRGRSGSERRREVIDGQTV